MNSIEPFIVEFKTQKGNRYIYDVTTNCIFPSSEIIIRILNNYKKLDKNSLIENLSHSYSKTEIEIAYQKISKWIKFEGAFFPANRIKILPMIFESEFKKKVANLSHIILVPTNQCNLRCKYCAFSGEYQYNRTHEDQTMSFNVAKRTINYFIDLLKSDLRTAIKHKGTIGFYGGEPLLHFPLIKKCMEYVKSIGFEDIIFWNFTTNGTLLTKEIVKYLMKYENIKIGISLDGPKVENDRHRIFSNGKGSFKVIMKNLQQIFSLNPEFYFKHIHFQPLLPRYNNPYNLVKFFCSHPLTHKNAISAQIGDITPGSQTFYNNLTIQKKKIFDARYNKLFHQYIDMLINGNEDSRKLEILSALAGYILQSIDRRTYRPLDSLSFSTGTCIPGTRKLYVATNGKFYICEKVTETYSIGDCNSGIDYQKCKEVYRKYVNSVTKNCYECPCIQFCSLCFSSAEEDNKFTTKNYCKVQQKILKAKLSDYYSILEENPQTFKLARASDEDKLTEF